MSESGGDLEVHSVNYQTEGEDIATDIGFIAGAYTPVVDSGNDSDRPLGYVYAPDGTPIGEWYVDADLAQQFADGEINQYEFAAEVLKTLKAYD